MKSNLSLLKLSFYAWMGVSLGLTAWAQTPPAGNYHKPVNEAASRVWDLSRVEDIEDVEFSISDDIDIEVSFLVNLTFSPVGQMTGSGNTQVDLHYDGSQGWTHLNFPATYKASGKIGSSKGVAKGSFAASISGRAVMEGAQRSLKASTAQAFTIDNSSGIVSFSSKSSASASGIGSVSDTDSWSEPMSALGVGNGYWTLHLKDLQTVRGKNVTGAAEAALSSGTMLEFDVKGTFDAKKNAAKLVLTGKGTSKGNSLQVGLENNVIKTIKGKLLGQSVDVK